MARTVRSVGWVGMGICAVTSLPVGIGLGKTAPHLPSRRISDLLHSSGGSRILASAAQPRTYAASSLSNAARLRIEMLVPCAAIKLALLNFPNSLVTVSREVPMVSAIS